MPGDQANLSATLTFSGAYGHETMLPDDKIETKVVLEHFLRLVENSTLDPGKLSSDGRVSDAVLNQFMDLLSFLRKWCKEYMVQLFCYCITQLLCQGALSGRVAFIFGVIADSTELCATALSIDFQPPMLCRLPVEVWGVKNTAHLMVLSALEREVGQTGRQDSRFKAGVRYKQLYEESRQRADR